MTETGSWGPYIGSQALILTVVLGIIAVALAILGARLHRALGAARPGKAVTFFLMCAVGPIAGDVLQCGWRLYTRI